MSQSVNDLLAIDIGNSNTVVGLFRDGRLVKSWRLMTIRERTSDEHAVLIKSLLSLAGYEALELEGVAVSCVVPPLLPVIKQMSSEHFQCEAFLVQPGIKTGMRILMDHPQEVGADRIVNAVAGFQMFGGPCIVIDFGTATTFDAVSEQGEYRGGIIAPGIMVAAEALFQNTAKLPRVEVKEPAEVIGKNTVSAIQSGIFYGYLGLIEKLIMLVKKELGEHCITIATGGIAPLIAQKTSEIQYTEPDLILQGLKILFEMNR